jgi:hypothetical protein
MALAVVLSASTAQVQNGPPIDLLAEIRSNPSAVWQGSTLRVFYRGPNDKLWMVHRTGRLSWSGGEDLNAPMTSGPAAVVWQRQTRIDVFYRGVNGHLWAVHFPDKPGGQWWSSGEDLNVEIVGSPAVVSRDDESLQVFFRGTNDHLWMVRWPEKPGGIWWSGGEDLRAEIASSPGATAWPDGSRIDVFYRGVNNHLWLVHWPDKPGSTWWSAGQDLNAEILSGPATYAARLTDGRTGVFVFYRGSENQLTQVRWPDRQGSTWWSAGSTFGARTIAEPSAVSGSFVFFQGENGRLWYLGEPTPAVPSPRVTITAAPDNGHIKVGASATVNWNVAECAQDCAVSLEARNGLNYTNLLINSSDVSKQGSFNITPTETHTKFTVTARSGAGTDSASIVVQLDGTPAPCTSCSWYYFKMSQQGLSWTYCYTVRIYAPNEDTAKQLAVQDGGFKAESINEQQFLAGCR